jgi:hypothetical protein
LIPLKGTQLFKTENSKCGCMNLWSSFTSFFSSLVLVFSGTPCADRGCTDSCT